MPLNLRFNYQTENLSESRTLPYRYQNLLNIDLLEETYHSNFLVNLILKKVRGAQIKKKQPRLENRDQRPGNRLIGHFGK